MAYSPASYRIVDEPRPSALARLTVAPFWPFLAIMLFGVFGFFWFALNAVVVGSATKTRQIVLIAVIVVIYWGLLFLNISLRNPLAMPWIQPYLLSVPLHSIQPYLFLIPLLWRLGCGYVLYSRQSLDVELFEHFDAGQPANGAIGLAIVFGCIMLLKQAASTVPLLFLLTL